MKLRHFIKDHVTYIGIILIQIVLIGAGFVLLSSSNKKEAITASTSPVKEIFDDSKNKEETKLKPMVTGTSTERDLIININTADIEELITLDGIGEAIAQKIVDYREEAGNFKTIEDIKNVSGIGDKKFEAIKNNITVE